MKPRLRKEYVLENLILAILWVAVLVIPLFRLNDQNAIDWEYAGFYWKRIAPFFLLFLVNNYLLVPRLLFRRKFWLYFLATVGVIFIFFTALPLVWSDYDRPPPWVKKYPKEQTIQYKKDHSREELIKRQRGHAGSSRDAVWQLPVIRMPVRVAPMVNSWLLGLLIVGFNLAIRFLFKSMRDDRRLKELQSHNLETELNYLKAQINPHFFMNTLNNIHALIDLDTEKAKETVIELSRLMRYVLYDANQPRILLSKEVQFLNNYIELMRIRYPDRVDIRVSVPEQIPDVAVPPLILVTFVENAFKHGVSYQYNSFIHIALSIGEGKIFFSVVNSCFKAQPCVQEGVGLGNVRKRLQLIYQENAGLHTEQTDEYYKIELTLPYDTLPGH